MGLVSDEFYGRYEWYGRNRSTRLTLNKFFPYCFYVNVELQENSWLGLKQCSMSGEEKLCGDITEAELMLGKERAFVLGIRKLDYLPETWTFIWKILASGKAMPVHLLGRL